MAGGDRHKVIEASHEARDIRNIISERIVMQQDNTLKALIAKYRGGQLKTEELWAGFGEIAGLNQFLQQLKNQVKQGEYAVAEEMKNGR